MKWCPWAPWAPRAPWAPMNAWPSRLQAEWAPPMGARPCLGAMGSARRGWSPWAPRSPLSVRVTPAPLPAGRHDRGRTDVPRGPRHTREASVTSLPAPAVIAPADGRCSRRLARVGARSSRSSPCCSSSAASASGGWDATRRHQLVARAGVGVGGDVSDEGGDRHGEAGQHRAGRLGGGRPRLCEGLELPEVGQSLASAREGVGVTPKRRF